MPVVAPVGTVVDMAEPVEFTVNEGTDVPLNVTLVVPVNLFPRIVTLEPILPDVGMVFMNGPRPTLRLKTVLPVPGGIEPYVVP